MIIKRRILQITLLITGLSMMIMGLLRGEALEVLRKATVVCMECIGIG